MNDKEKKETEENKGEATEETKSESPKPPQPEKKPELPPINLTKTQMKLYTSKMVDIEAMKRQNESIINSLGNEVKRNLVETFAEELGIDLTAKKYEFNRETLTFVDYNILRERARMQQGMPTMRIPNRKPN